MIVNKVAYKILVKKGNELLNEFEENSKKAMEVNENLLLHILDENKNTVYGKLFKFNEIRNSSEFKSKVPLNNYSDFKPYIDEMAKGYKNVLIKAPIEYFSHSSGTTGSQKLLINTKESRKKASRYMGMLTEAVVFNHLKYKWTYERGVMLTDMVATSKTKGGTTVSSATSGGMRGIKPIIPYIWTTPPEVMDIRDKEDSMYLHLLFALRESELMYIGGTFISSVLDFFRILEMRWEDIVEDIESGKVGKNISLDSGDRKILDKKLKPMEDRARFLRKEFKKGFEGIAKRIWPNLISIMTVTGGPFAIYDNKVRYYIGNIAIYSSVYGTSEAAVGINLNLEKISYVLIPDAAYFEFIKEEDIEKRSPKTYNLDSLEIGQSYEVVVTTATGLYRYRLSDIIKVIGYHNGSPEMTFMYRKNQLLNMVSEKTTENHIKDALKAIEEEYNLNIIDYTTMADNSKTPGRYKFFIEFKEHIDSIKKIESIIDRKLCESNVAYGRLRERKALGMLSVMVLKKGSFNKFQEVLLRNGASKNQLKIPRVIVKEEYIKYLETM